MSPGHKILSYMDECAGHSLKKKVTKLEREAAWISIMSFHACSRWNPCFSQSRGCEFYTFVDWALGRVQISPCWRDIQQYYRTAVTGALPLSSAAFVKAYKQLKNLNISTAQAVTFKLFLKVITLPTSWHSTNIPVLSSCPKAKDFILMRSKYVMKVSSSYNLENM